MRTWLPSVLCCASLGLLACNDKPAPAGAPSNPSAPFQTVKPPTAVPVQPKPVVVAPSAAELESPPADAVKTASGLAYKVITKGTGAVHPTATNVVRVHYTGWQASDGRMFDSSVVRGAPTEFPLNQVIAGWTEGVQKMVEGEKTRFWIPAQLAYGDSPKRPGMPYGTLVFDVELIKIAK